MAMDETNLAMGQTRLAMDKGTLLENFFENFFLKGNYEFKIFFENFPREPGHGQNGNSLLKKTNVLGHGQNKCLSFL